MDNIKVKNNKTQRNLAHTFSFCGLVQQLRGEFRSVQNRLVFLVGFSDGSKKTNALFFTPYYPERIKRLDIYDKMCYNACQV